MDCITNNVIIDRILSTYKSDLGKDFEQYRNHVYRVYNFALPFVTSVRDIETLSIAAAFHDLGIWTNKTFDYLKPSIDLVKAYSSTHDLEPETLNELETIINDHHKLTKIKSLELAENFRQADLVDLSLGLIRCGRKRKHIRMVKKNFPNKGFHCNLFRLFVVNLLNHPLKPLPMYKI